MDLEIPPQFQLLVALVIGTLVAVGAVYKFFRDLKEPDAAAPDLRILGAALGDSRALAELRDEIRHSAELVIARADKSDDLIRENTRTIGAGLDKISATIRAKRQL